MVGTHFPVHVKHVGTSNMNVYTLNTKAYLSSNSESLPDVVLANMCPDTFDFLLGTSASLETASSNLYGQEGNGHIKTVY